MADADTRRTATNQPSNQAWFERAVEAAGHAIFITDANGRIVYVNPAFESITGYDAADAIGRTPNLLNADHHDQSYFCRLWTTIRAGDVWREEIVNRRAGGERYVAEQTIAPITDEDGTITHFVSIQTDVTERREHEHALERSRDLLARTEEAADVGGWELALDTEELRWTPGTRRIHGVEPAYEPSIEEAIEFYHPTDRRTVRTFVERALEWELPYDVEARLVTTDGSTRFVRTTGQPVVVDGETLLRGTIQDVTEQTARRQQLMVFNRVLRHNLRNGLNVVAGRADGLLTALDADGDLSTDLARTDLDAIVSAAEELLDVAERARRFDNLYRRIRDSQPVEIRPLLDAIVAEYRDAAPRATIRVEGAAPVVLVNRRAVRVAVEELVDNAVEHSSDGAPTVTVRARERGDGSLEIAVADRGDGIPEMEREVIVEGEERPLKHGSGLGLWLVKWLVTAMGGTVEITANEPSGTVVSLVFPAARWIPDDADASAR
jgi:PAS domain S-box-containing protein